MGIRSFVCSPSALLLACTALAAPSHGQNRALFLDGSPGGVDVPGSPSLDVQTAFTLEGWHKFESGGPIVLRKDGFDRGPYWLQATSVWTDVLVNWWHNHQAGSSCNQGNSTAVPGPWTHVAASFDGTTVNLYRNGVLVNSCALQQPESQPSIPVHIGWGDSVYGGLSYQRGWIDEVRIWNVARTQQQIVEAMSTTIDSALAPSYPGLVACWNFEGNANDSTGVNNGAAFGTAVFLAAHDIPYPDCNGNGMLDALEISAGTGADCDGDGRLDSCQIAADATLDLNSNAVLDECECLSSIYCIGAPNSVGPGARGDYTGTVSVGLNNLTLLCTGLPPSTNGLFYFGPSQAQVAFGNGYRCVSGSVVRTGIVQASPTGNASKAVNNGVFPFAGLISPGSTWNFQFWYRNVAAGGAGFNLSDGLSVRFCP
ncbi:MAG: LamG domain-containing protein [Planctomycetota bacterium]|nr:LamG domain-containing protein [Planctomycetota bacterium]